MTITTETIMIAQTLVITLTLLVLLQQNWSLKKQNRQLQNTIYASNYVKLIDMLKDLRTLRIADPSLAHVYGHEFKGLSKKAIRYHFFNLIVLSIFEVLYMDRELGLAREETWTFWRDSIRKIAYEQSFRDMFLRESYKIVHPAFAEEVRSLVEEVELELSIQADSQEPVASAVMY